MKKYSKFLSISAALLVGNMATAGDYTLSAGAEYTNGDYGTSIDTTMFQIPLTLGYTNEQYDWSVTVPYVRINGSEDVTFSSATRSPKLSTATTSNVKSTASGLGDIILSGTYQLQNETKTSPWFAITGKIKLGTADEKKRLGTGENDYSVQAEVAKKALHAFVGYKLVGDTSTVNFNDVSYGAIGITVPINKKWTSVAEFYTEQAAVSGIDNVQELSVSLSKSLGDKKKMSVYIVKGFTDSSPDWGAGISIRYPL